MKLPSWLAWWFIRATMKITVLRLVLRGMPWAEARRRVAESTKLFMHREVHPQWGDGGADGVSCKSPGGEGDGGPSVGPTSNGDAPRQAASTPPTSTPGAPTAGGPSAPSEKEGA